MSKRTKEGQNKVGEEMINHTIPTEHRISMLLKGGVRQRVESQNLDRPSETDTAETSPADTESGPSAGPDDDPKGQQDQRDTELSLDQVFEILKNSRRRQTLHYLFENDGKATLSELAEHIAALENDVDIKAITSSQRKRVYVGLYQCHLPKMDDMDVVDFEKNRGNVEVATNAFRFKPYLDQTEDPDWHFLYAGVTAGGVGLFGLSLLEPLSVGLTPTVVLVLVLVAMVACSGLHTYYESTSQ